MEKDNVTPLFIRPRHISDKLNIDIQVIYNAIASGDLPATRFKGKSWLIRPQDADEWVTRHSEPSMAGVK
jgi:excisionase family DNA binding protein